MDIWAAYVSRLLRIMLLCTCVHKYIFETLLSILSIYPEVVLLNSMVILFLIFQGTVILFSIVAAPFPFSPIACQGSDLSTSSPALVIFCFLESSHPNWCEVISHCGFDCISLMISDVEHHFI